MSVTYNPKKKKRRRTHGFLARKNRKNQTGDTIQQRRRKGRKRLAVE